MNWMCTARRLGPAMGRLAIGVGMLALAVSACGDDGSSGAAGADGSAAPTGSMGSTVDPTSSPSPTAPLTEASPSTATPPVTDSPSASPRPTTTREVRVLTERDSGAAVALAIGESVSLRLSHDWLWSTPQVEGSAVVLAPVEYFADPGYTEWSVEAVRPGKTVVRIEGSRQCPSTADCGPDAQLVYEFEVQR